MIVRFSTFNCGSLLARGATDTHLQLSEERHAAKCRAIADALSRIRPDVATLQEVVERESVEQVLEVCGSEMKIVAASDPASRETRTWLLSRLPATEVRVHDDGLDLVSWRGDALPSIGSILDARVRTGDSSSVRVLAAHLKSKRAVDPVLQDELAPGTLSEWATGALYSGVKRTAQALRIRRLIDESLHEDPDTRLLLMGDLNDTPASITLEILMGDHEAARRVALRKAELVAVASALSADRRFSHLYRGRRLLLDHILVSRALWRGFVRTEIHNEGLDVRSRSAEEQLGESDHAPVLADFRL